MNVPITQIRASGGGARSQVWRQILADVFGTELVTVNVTESTAYGAALLAGVGTGVFESVQQACSATIQVQNPMDPIKDNVSVYEDYYQVYHSLYLYNALKPSFDAVSNIE